jgi:hypothetical protein
MYENSSMDYPIYQPEACIAYYDINYHAIHSSGW